MIDTILTHNPSLIFLLLLIVVVVLQSYLLFRLAISSKLSNIIYKFSKAIKTIFKRGD